MIKSNLQDEGLTYNWQAVQSVLGLQHGISCPTQINLLFLWAYVWHAHLRWEEIKSCGAYRKAPGSIVSCTTMYTCPKCKKSISKQVRTLIRHLRQVHAISDVQDYKTVCSQNHCQRTYHYFNSYAKQINREHSQVSNPVHLEQMVNFSNVSEEVSSPSCPNAMDTNENLGSYLDIPMDRFLDCAASFVAKVHPASNSTLTDNLWQTGEAASE